MPDLEMKQESDVHLLGNTSSGSLFAPVGRFSLQIKRHPDIQNS